MDKQRVVLDKSPWLTVEEQQVVLPNGHVIDDYIITEIPSFSMVFAITSTGDLLLVEQLTSDNYSCR